MTDRRVRVMAKVRLGIIGAGNMGSGHINN